MCDFSVEIEGIISADWLKWKNTKISPIVQSALFHPYRIKSKGASALDAISFASGSDTRRNIIGNDLLLFSLLEKTSDIGTLKP